MRSMEKVVGGKGVEEDAEFYSCRASKMLARPRFFLYPTHLEDKLQHRYNTIIVLQLDSQSFLQGSNQPQPSSMSYNHNYTHTTQAQI